MRLKKPEELKKIRVNCLQEMLAELMTRDGVELVDVQKATGIPWGTLHSWAVESVSCQKLDINILQLARFFNVSINYLAFGVGTDAPFSNNHEQ